MHADQQKPFCKIEMELISNASVAVMDNELRQRLSHAANSLNLSHIDLSSGAGHDMVHLRGLRQQQWFSFPARMA